jgi:multidrug transporter EmrE-like cation transporter
MWVESDLLKWYWQITAEATMSPHAPSKGWFIASLIIAVIALIGALSPIPYITAYGVWVALLAYVVLVIGNLAQTSSDTNRSTRSGRRGVIH